MKNLQEVIDFIASKYVFSEEHYPALAGMDADARLAFAITHSILHMNKSIGKIATECEIYDYGGKQNHEEMRIATVKMFIDTLKLVEELGMNADDLFHAVPEVMKSK